VLARIVADALGVGAEVSPPATPGFHWEWDVRGRGAVVAGSACHAADVRAQDSRSASSSGVRRTAGAWRRPRASGQADTGPRSGRPAAQAEPIAWRPVPGTEPGLESGYFGPDRGSTASGVHAMIVEVDPETAMVEIKRYVVVHDCGTIINPMLVEGQIHGGVAHGIGNAFYEQLVYDEQGQLLNASFMDYLIPSATDVPPIETAHRTTPSPYNPVGLRGVGEAGCIPTGALFAQAVEDALAGSGVEITEIPLSPNRLFEIIEAAKK
jgi:CO/xanthine dehydrogenase Mo-binding subunit